MDKADFTPERYLGLSPNQDYILTEYIGEGKIGMVFRAKSERTGLSLACKVIREGGLKEGWERELEKVRKLQGVPHVVEYRDHGSNFDREQRPYYWVFFDFIDGRNLRTLLANPGFTLTMSFVESVLRAVLGVLHACAIEGISHGDLHAGNILVKRPDRRILNSKRTVYVSDFGYGGSHNDVKPKNDFLELAVIIQGLLAHLPPSELNSRDKNLRALLVEFARKRIRDVGRTPGVTVEKIFTELEELCRKAERQSATGAGEDDDQNKKPTDYLWAEALGTRIQEWKNLFVPNFLAANDLLAKTTTVLTGARGCGKTMSFRRLTKLMDAIIGESSGVSGAGTFVGFYLNCRDLTDAFPWIPNELKAQAERQVIHFFHLAWLAEILKTLAYADQDEAADYRWLENWFGSLYGEHFARTSAGEKVLAHVRSFVEAEKERSRITPLGKEDGTAWPLARTDLLDSFFRETALHLAWLASSPVFLFLDDYTIPLVPRSIQLALNPIIFRRRSDLFFKVSTEAANSFVASGPRKKPLELHHDFVLLDLATESLHQKEAEKEGLLDSIFRPRIKRHTLFAASEFGLEDMLGKTPYDNNGLAWQMRRGLGSEEKQRVCYHGKSVFVGLWTSDIRTMVEMFNDMLREANGRITAENPIIPKETQDRCIRNQGGEMMTFTQSIRDYELCKQTKREKGRAEKFGNHLKSIVEAFIGVARYELLEGPPLSNQGRENPRQAFRIEVVDSFEPDRRVRGYLEGLVRYHIFLQDWRGKSQRGMLTPRLYLNRMFLPYGGLTLSSHDHIQLTNCELMQLLEWPTRFLDYWKRKRSQQAGRKKHRDGAGQQRLTL
ncbi:MAG: protein kinase [Verrucomicrobia bacterium]|nr:protein kinase [Verrucomicrobiota bacterium]